MKFWRRKLPGAVGAEPPVRTTVTCRHSIGRSSGRNRSDRAQIIMASYSESLISRIAERERSMRNKTPGSLQRFERSARTLAGGVSSGLRRSARPYPLFFDRGKGSRVWDVDGNPYLDFGLAWGPLILGHAPDPVADAISVQVRKGLTFGAQHDLEFEVSELLNEIIPCADLVAFANSGTE